MRGTWHFYTDDSRFTRLWARPDDVTRSGCCAAIEPNWSVHPQTPRAAVLWSTFRKRWLARAWQAHGVRIIVDLNVAPEHAELNMLGVPHGWPAYATRGSVHRLPDIERELTMARTHAGRESVLFLVYGGGQAVEARCAQLGVVWVPEERDTLHGS